MKKNFLIAGLFVASISGLMTNLYGATILKGTGGTAIGQNVASSKITSSNGYSVSPLPVDIISTSTFDYIVTDVKEIEMNKDNVLIYLNQETGEITVSLKQEISCTASLYDIQGHKIAEGNISSDKNGFAVPTEMTAGAYILNLTNENGKLIYSSKILKQKK